MEKRVLVQPGLQQTLEQDLLVDDLQDIYLGEVVSLPLLRCPLRMAADQLHLEQDWLWNCLYPGCLL